MEREHEENIRSNKALRQLLKVDLNQYRCCNKYSVTMFISLYLDRFDDTYINFMDTKENTITNGVFTKILYSEPLFTMNGLHFLFPIVFTEVYNNNYNKTFIKFQPKFHLNNNILIYLSRIEESVLHTYNNKKAKMLKLQEQLKSGCVKVNTTSRIVPGSTKFSIKISGVWENSTSIGITYKISKIQ